MNRNLGRRVVRGVLLSVLPWSLALADEPPATVKGIQDNSFLVEEAYNQDPGVVQHISNFLRDGASGDWLYTFTQEWPVPRQKHQLSFTLPYQRLHASPGGKRGIGDVLLNYRYQLLGDDEARVAIAPRFSLVLPTGDYKAQLGGGALGYQVELPISVVLTDTFVTHVNLGAAYTPSARDPAGDRADTTTWNFAQSFVWLARPRLDLLVEIVCDTGETVTGPGRTDRVDTFLVSPGIRWAYNIPSGLQIVPGVAFPIGTGPSSGDRAVFLYLSFEAPVWRPR